MTTEVILSGNEVLAVWMGAELIQTFQNGEIRCYGYRDKPRTHTFHDLQTNCGLFHTALRFNTSWDWLMPVWYKFRELKFEDRQNTSIHHTYCMDIERKICRECKDSPEPAFNELVKAVTWYNTIKKG